MKVIHFLKGKGAACGVSSKGRVVNVAWTWASVNCKYCIATTKAETAKTKTTTNTDPDLH